MLKTLLICLLLFFVLLIPFAVPFIITAMIKNSKKAAAPNVCYSGSPQPPYHSSGQQSYRTGTPQHKLPPQRTPEKTRPDLTTSTILFLIGTCFVVLSGLAFGAASWVRTSHEGRAAIIAAAAAVSFALCTVIYKFLRLSGTAISFYSLGTGLTATLMITAGYYGLMGEWFSVHGGGAAVLIASACAVSALLFFIGGRIFGKKVFTYSGLSATALMLFFAAAQIGGEFENTAAILMGLQTVITAAIYAVKPAGKNRLSAPVKIVGSIASLLYALTAFIYVLSSAVAPTVFSYIIMGLIISQLVFYGALRNDKRFIAAETAFSVFTACLAAITTGIELSLRMSVIVFGVIVIAIYLIHRALPFFRNAFSEIFSLSIVILAGAFGLAQAGRNGFVPELLIASAAALFIALYVFNKYKGVQIAAGLFAPILPIFITASFQECISYSALYIDEDTVKVLCWSALAFIFIAFAAIILLLPRISFSIHAHHPRKTDTVLYSLLIVSGLILLPVSGYSSVFMLPAALCVMHFALSNRLRFNMTAILPILSVTTLVYSVTDYYSDGKHLPVTIAMLVTFIIFIIVSKLVYPGAFAEKRNERYVIDTLLLSAWLPILLMFHYSKPGFFFTLIASAIYASGFIKKKTSKNAARTVLTIASALAAIAFYFRPFLISDSDMMNSKVIIAIIVIFGFLCRLIWRADRDCAKFPSNIVFIIAFSALLYDMLIFDTALNTIFGMSVMLFILMVSIITKNRTWFIASSAALFTVTLYSTREYLMSLSWWVYLFFAGLVLITIAAANEYYKTKGETVKTTVTKTFRKWNW